MLRSITQARNIIDTFKPDAVFSKGGIVSIPLCYIAHQKHIPIVLHESDAVMGKANRLITRWAMTICLGFPQENSRSSQLIAHSSIVTGNPIRPHITDGSRAEGLRLTGLSGTRPILLVIGGSQGAQALNDAVTTQIDALMKFVDIVHLTGRGKTTSIKRGGYWQTEFAQEELPHLYAIADIALSRAGAGSIGELAANNIATVLVPIEGLANNHQFLNAIAAQENGGCILLLQAHLTPGLSEVIGDLIKNPKRREEISQSMGSLYHPDAAGRIAKILVECVAQHPSSH
jgi:UDP-N-acetylglucosamine--N-acetylmuramyl-(pentapeptide) pyrophosphoryl-undecaprenol N-acetylglucosamine transferase